LYDFVAKPGFDATLR